MGARFKKSVEYLAKRVKKEGPALLKPQLDITTNKWQTPLNLSRAHAAALRKRGLIDENAKVRKFQGVVNLLAEHGVDALKPRIMNGRWVAPIISKRKAAVQRKKAILDGSFGAFSIEKGGGWDPAWDPIPRPIVARPYKLHKRQRTRAARAAKIDAALLGQDELHFKRLKENKLFRRKKPGLMEVIKTMTAFKRRRTQARRGPSR